MISAARRIVDLRQQQQQQLAAPLASEPATSNVNGRAPAAQGTQGTQGCGKIEVDNFTVQPGESQASHTLRLSLELLVHAAQTVVVAAKEAGGCQT